MGGDEVGAGSGSANTEIDSGSAGAGSNSCEIEASECRRRRSWISRCRCEEVGMVLKMLEEILDQWASECCWCLGCCWIFTWKGVGFVGKRVRSRIFFCTQIARDFVGRWSQHESLNSDGRSMNHWTLDFFWSQAKRLGKFFSGAIWNIRKTIFLVAGQYTAEIIFFGRQLKHGELHFSCRHGTYKTFIEFVFFASSCQTITSNYHKIFNYIKHKVINIRCCQNFIKIWDGVWVRLLRCSTLFYF